MKLGNLAIIVTAPNTTSPDSLHFLTHTFLIMFQHRLPNGNIIMHEGLPRELAIKRMEDEARWIQEHREELEVSSQQLFDDMFGG